MSVDFYIYNFPGAKMPAKDSDGSFVCPPLGERYEVRRQISACFRRTTWRTEKGGDLEAGGASIEFYTGTAPQCQSVMASIAGEIDNGIVALARICRRYEWSLFDPQSGKLMDLGEIPKRMKGGAERDSGVAWTVTLEFQTDANGKKKLVSVENTDGRVPSEVMMEYGAQIEGEKKIENG
jgi:hypothetical protein